MQSIRRQTARKMLTMFYFAISDIYPILCLSTVKRRLLAHSLIAYTLDCVSVIYSTN